MAQGAPAQDKSKVIIGRIGAPHGVKGWLKVHSFTEPRENILKYQPWLIKRHDTWQALDIVDATEHSSHLVVQFKECYDRNAAQLLTGVEIAVERDQLPKLSTNEFYWSDLEGLMVNNTDGIVLGKVEYLMETGANDVLVVKGEKQHLIPFLLEQYILNIDLDKKVILVDWDADF